MLHCDRQRTESLSLPAMEPHCRFRKAMTSATVTGLKRLDAMSDEKSDNRLNRRIKRSAINAIGQRHIVCHPARIARDVPGFCQKIQSTTTGCRPKPARNSRNGERAAVPLLVADLVLRDAAVSARLALFADRAGCQRRMTKRRGDHHPTGRVAIPLRVELVGARWNDSEGASEDRERRCDGKHGSHGAPRFLEPSPSRDRRTSANQCGRPHASRRTIPLPSDALSVAVARTT